MLYLDNVTLFGLDTINYEGLLEAAKLSKRHIHFNNVILLGPQDVDVKSGADYSRFMLGALPGLIHTEYVLVIQADGYVLNPDAWDADFMNYDYVGAPWPYPERDVGNGGFSLRSSKFIQVAHYIYEGDSKPEFHPEDNYSCRIQYDKMIDLGIKFAPAILAKKFSMEGNPKYGFKWNGQFGFHNNRITDISDYANFT
jgi:hypothetical protein